VNNLHREFSHATDRSAEKTEEDGEARRYNASSLDPPRRSSDSVLVTSCKRNKAKEIYTFAACSVKTEMHPRLPSSDDLLTKAFLRRLSFIVLFVYKGAEGEGSALTGLQKTGLILAKVVVTRHPSKRLGASSLPSVGFSRR
jgi:hypothetical protein